MLLVALICPDQDLSAEVLALLARIPDLEVAATLPSYPEPDDLQRMVRLRGVGALLMSVEDFARAENLAAALDQALPGFPLITLSRQGSPYLLSKLMQLGVRDHLVSPIPGLAIADAIDSARRRSKAAPAVARQPAEMYGFLPARGGVGGSTIATATSCALVSDLNLRTLLMDCDLEAGALQFLLRLGKSASLIDALTHYRELDDGWWSQMVGRWKKLEVLHAGRLDPPPEIPPAALGVVLQMARAQYEVICLDLPSSVNPFSVALMRECTRIFLVTTPEVISLHMAAVRVRQLAALGLKERVSLILNRKIRSKKIADDTESTVGLPVTHALVNDYAGVQTAILDGSPALQNGELRKNILSLAQSLAPSKDPAGSRPRRKFLEFFHLPNMHESGVM